jgi:hypothetical protein
VTRAEAPYSDPFGSVYDNQDIYNDGTAYPSQPAAIRLISQDEPVDIPEGDYLIINADGGQVTYVYPPPISGAVEVYYYIGRDGSTYSDRWLCESAKVVPTPTATAPPSTTPTPSASPPPTTTPTTTPRFTPAPSRTATPVPSPTPTIIRCFNVSGRVTRQSDSSPMAGALVRAFAPAGISPVTSTDGNGNYRATVCTHHRNGTVWAGARIKDYLPMHSQTDYTEWGDVSGVNIELALASMMPGIVDGDYDGDGRPDIAIFRPATSLWSVRGITRVYFGTTSDDPVPADYSGDGTSQVAIFRGATGLWAIRGVTRIYFGNIIDLPEPGDYTGDGTCELAVFRNPTGLWSVRGFQRWYFGGAYDQSLAADYDGDGVVEPAIFRGSAGLWAIRGISRLYYGREGDRTVPGDYYGDGARWPAIFRPASGLWAIRDLTRVYFGRSGDLPVPADYRGQGTENIGVFRGTTGLWAIRNFTRKYFGGPTDIPVTR